MHKTCWHLVLNSWTYALQYNGSSTTNKAFFSSFHLSLFIGLMIREPSRLRKEGSLWKLKCYSFSFWKEMKTLGSIRLYLHLIRKEWCSSGPFTHEPGVELGNHMWTRDRGLQWCGMRSYAHSCGDEPATRRILMDPLSRNTRTCMLNRNHWAFSMVKLLHWNLMAPSLLLP